MEKYKKKPVEIEAVQWDGSVKEATPIVDWILYNGGTARFHGTGCLYIETLEGTMLAEENDWIIKGIKDEFYPCKPDIFEMTYDKVE